jgi:predicted small secreted protein
MRLTLIFLSAVVCLTLAAMARTMRGFGWQVHRAGEPVYRTENGHGWAEKGSVPPEWEQIKDDPTIDAAKLYTSAQQRVRADRRRILDSKEAS